MDKEYCGEKVYQMDDKTGSDGCIDKMVFREMWCECWQWRYNIGKWWLQLNMLLI